MENDDIKNTLPWVEKYRPKNIDDLILEQTILNKIKTIIENRDMPNIIITGLPGIGKTSTIHCLANKLLGKYKKEGVIELNASDDRGIKAIQETILFCKKKLFIKKLDKHLYAQHKIILLDEADNMTIKAQRLVNNLMETYRKSTRFVFTCNNSSDIIEAIQSRCVILKYSRISDEQIIYRLGKICSMESIKSTYEGLQLITTISYGDMRQAINYLQLISNSYNEITEETFKQVCYKPLPSIIKNIIISCKKKISKIH